MSGSRTYCDYNATAPLRPEAAAVLARALGFTGNASSVHAEGRKARAMVETAREQVAASIGACRDDIAFTSGGTEAVQAPIRGAMRQVQRAVLVASGIEHDAVGSVVREYRFAPSPLIPACVGTSGERDTHDWQVQPSGVVDLDWLRQAVSAIAAAGARPFVSLMLVNNETGVIQPVAEAAAIVHAAGGLIHCDAVQGLGKMTVSVVDLDVDYLSVSSHKIGGPQGVGAFYVRSGAPFQAVQTGGGQEFGRRAGTENVAGVAAFGVAAEAAASGVDGYEALRPARDAFEARLKDAVAGLVVHGEAARRVGAVSCFGVEGLPSETQIMGLDLAGFAVSAGAACSSGKVKASHVLTAMGVDDVAARSAIRASFGWASRTEEFDALADAWIAMAKRARPQLTRTEARRDAG